MAEPPRDGDGPSGSLPWRLLRFLAVPLAAIGGIVLLLHLDLGLQVTIAGGVVLFGALWFWFRAFARLTG